MIGFELILPFLRPIEHLISDPTISEVMVNPTKRVWIERDGRLEEVTDVRLDDRNLRVAIQNIARILGDDFSEERPLLDARLPDGSRVAAALPPCSIDGIALTIRKFGSRYFNADELVAVGSLPRNVLDMIVEALLQRENIVFSGSTGSGKTTLLGAIADFIPDEERVFVIEDTAELRINKPNLVRFEARQLQPPYAAVTTRDLVRATMRHHPGRIIFGEIRGGERSEKEGGRGEAFDLLHALSSGHCGMTTVHANSARQALTRLANCVLMSDVQWPYQAIRAALAETFSLIVHVERRDRLRGVREVVRVRHYDPERDLFTFESLYVHGHDAAPGP